jgi:hypothetical protein
MSGLIACVGAPASTVSAGPAATTGIESVTFDVPDLLTSNVLVAAIVTDAGTGYGVT